MRALTLRQELTSQLEHSQERVREAIAGLSEGEASRAAPDGWSIKDHLTHMTLWHEMRFFEISRIARGGRASFHASTEEQVTPLNEVFAAVRSHLSLEQVVADLEFAWQMVGQAVAACPDDRLEPRLYEEIGIAGGAEHDLEHAATIQRLRADTPSRSS